jgi:monoterpene epsilon-lactone hydrolase
MSQQLEAVRALLAFARHGGVVGWRRLRRGRGRPSWTWMAETLVESLRAQTRERLSRASTPGARARPERAPEAEQGRRGNVRWRALRLAGVAAECYEPGAGQADVSVLFLHGGGYTSGAVAESREFLGRLVRATNARIIGVEYRLAPRHPFPAAVDDAVAAYMAMLDGEDRPRTPVMVGMSAGAGLAVATTLRLRDAGAPLPAAIACLCPWADLALDGPSCGDNAAWDWCIRDELAAQAAAYLGAASPREPLASPIHAELRGLPPMLVQAGGAEILLDDARRLAARARADGVQVDLQIWDDMFHAWQLYPDLIPQGQQAIQAIARFVQAHTDSAAATLAGAHGRRGAGAGAGDQHG